MSAGRKRVCANVLGIDVQATNMDGALRHISEALQQRRKGYVCFANVHGVMEAQRSSALADIYAHALLTLPDGMPTVWAGRLQGHADMCRVAGPELMLEVFRRPEFANYTHYLCGGKDGVAEELRDNLARLFPRTKVVGIYTPPFRELSLIERDDFLASVRHSKPDMIWVGISTPKQEQFMERFLPFAETTLMFAVGAAFDFHTGRIRTSPDWVKKAGLQWIHRLLQDPRHLWKRHLRNNPGFVWRIVMQMAGWRNYDTPASIVHDLQLFNEPAVLRKTGSEL